MKSWSSGIGPNLVWMVVGTVWSGVCQWAQLIALAKLGTVDLLGTFTLGMAIALPVLMFSCLNLRNLYVTDHACEYRFREYLTLRLITACGSVALIAAIGSVGGHTRDLVSAVILIGMAKAIEYISDILYGLLQRQENMALMSISMILRGTLSLTTLALALYFSGSLIWGAAGLVLSSVVTLVAFDIPVCLTRLNTSLSAALGVVVQYAGSLCVRRDRSRARLRSLALAGLPLGFVLMLVSLNVSIPRYFVERSLGIREQGIFSSIANLVAAGNVVIGALGQSATPRLAKYFATGDLRAFRALLWMLILTSLGLGAAGLTVAVTAGRQALTLIYRPEYAARQDIFIWLMAASGALYLGNTMGVAMTAVRCLTPQLPLFAAAAATTALACFVLVPVWGLKGAAMSVFVSALIQSGGGAWLLWNACRPGDSQLANG